MVGERYYVRPYASQERSGRDAAPLRGGPERQQRLRREPQMHRSALGALIQRGIFVQPLRDYLFSKGRNHATSVVIPPQQEGGIMQQVS